MRNTTLRINVLLVLISASLMISCSDEPKSSYDSIRITIDTLRVSDTIGVLSGDTSFMFSHIAVAEPLPDGCTAVLDSDIGVIRIFNASIEPILEFGGHGEGPGEFQHPIQMARLPSGDFVVYDLLMSSISLFNENGIFLDRWNLSQNHLSMAAIVDLLPMGDSSFAAYTCSVVPKASCFEVEYALRRYDAYSGAILAEYFNWNGEITSDTEAEVPYLSFTVDNESNIYLARSDDQAWKVEKVDIDGVPLDTFRLGLSGDRLQVESDTVHVPGTYPISMTISGNRVVYGRSSFYPLISDLECDGEGNIWARRGGPSPDKWDVVSDDGQYLRTIHVVTPQASKYLDLRVNQYGILGLDPDNWISSEYPCVYKLLLNSENAD